MALIECSELNQLGAVMSPKSARQPWVMIFVWRLLGCSVLISLEFHKKISYDPGWSTSRKKAKQLSLRMLSPSGALVSPSGQIHAGESKTGSDVSEFIRQPCDSPATWPRLNAVSRDWLQTLSCLLSITYKLEMDQWADWSTFTLGLFIIIIF